MGDMQTLIDMGFAKEKVEYAIKATNNKGVEAAMDWLLAHADEDVPAAEPVESPPPAEAGNDNAGTSSGTSATSAVANAANMSLKCDDCGKILTDSSEIAFHAAKTGHHKFSESNEEKKPLTEEEKKTQLALIEEKLKRKRREREEREKIEALEREKNRIKSGKDMTEARKRMEELEMKKIVEQRKREKAEEKAARERVRAQIEADKAARKAREQNGVNEQPEVASPAKITSVTNTATPSKGYTQTRIQVRLRDGSTLAETFGVKEQLSAVRVFIQMKTGDDAPFNLMTSFPRKVFNDEDFEKPLDILGLVPSAVLIMTKLSPYE